MSKYELTVVVYVHNNEETLEEAINSAERQIINGGKEIEIIVVNDGSTDNSHEKCLNITEGRENYKYIQQEFKGNAYSKNLAIKEAQGKYIMFLNGDDELMRNTLDRIIKQFNAKEKHTDILVYPFYYRNEDMKLEGFWQIRHFNENKLVNLEKYPNFIQVDRNIVIKKESNVVFREDIEYGGKAIFNIENLLPKLKVAVSEEGGCIINEKEKIIEKNHKLPSRVSEKILSLFEEYIKNALSKYEKVPRVIQNSILHEINWRFKENCLYPDHLKNEERKKWDKRFIDVLKHIEIETIMRNDQLDYFHKIHFVEKKTEGKIKAKVIDGKVLFNDLEEREIAKIDKFTLVFNKFKNYEDKIHIIGTVKAPLLNYLGDMEVIISENGKEKERIKLKKISNESRYKVKMFTNTFYLFEYEVDLNNYFNDDLSFEIGCLNEKFPTTSYMMEKTDFKTSEGLFCFQTKNKMVKYKNNPFTINISKHKMIDKVRFLKKLEDKKILKLEVFKEMASLNNKKNIWIYNDRINVFDNAYIQFKNDFKKNDGKNRFYVTYKKENIQGKFTQEEMKNVVIYGSPKHIKLLCQAEYVLTAFQAEKEYNPLSKIAKNIFSEVFTFKVVYLQHGILHAHTPWIYSKERSKVDYFLISSNFEKEMLTGVYNYEESDLINLKMPRFNKKEKPIKKENKILFAPSWRIYFTNGMKGIDWIIDEKEFLTSEYYLNINGFLKDEKLNKILKESNTKLHFNLHPIFKDLKNYFETNSENIQIVDKPDAEESYGMFITDFSSFVFDFVHHKTPISFFVPDQKDFLAGNHIYRKLELDSEKYFGKTHEDKSGIIEEIEKNIKNNFIIDDKYKSNYENFFNEVEHPSEELYKKLLNKEA